jgi:hypothetical protein
MSKQPLLSADLMAKKGEATVSSFAEPAESLPVQQNRKLSKQADLVTITVKLERDIYKALKNRSVDERISNQKLVSQAIVFFLNKEG